MSSSSLSKKSTMQEVHMLQEKKEIIKIGGEIDFKISEIYQGSSVKLKALHELSSWLHCFLISIVYPGKPKQALSVLKKMLTHAVLHPNIIIFSFPDDIKRQFRLPNTLTIPLKIGAGFAMYMDELLKRAKLACVIEIDITVKEKKYAIVQVQNALQKSHTRIDRIKISVDKKTLEFIGIINIPKKRIQVNAFTLQELLALIRANI